MLANLRFIHQNEAIPYHTKSTNFINFQGYDFAMILMVICFILNLKYVIYAKYSKKLVVLASENCVIVSVQYVIRAHWQNTKRAKV